MKLKAQIACPRVYESLELGRPYTIFGAAWARATDVTEFWVSLDGGSSWVQGHFLDPINRNAWRRWKYDWITPTQPGRYALLARQGCRSKLPAKQSRSEFGQLCDQ
jgi:hypothetical protein